MLALGAQAGSAGRACWACRARAAGARRAWARERALQAAGRALAGVRGAVAGARGAAASAWERAAAAGRGARGGRLSGQCAPGCA